MYDEMLKFVKDTLTERGGIKSKNIYHPFRNRYEHTKRVFKWLERIMPDCPNCDRDVAAIATIFHDVGYGGDEFKTHHAERSTIIFRKYAQDNLDLPKEKLEQIEQIILCHSDKSLILNEKSSDELVLMLEADLLDEEGALGIAFDLLSAGAKMPTSYQNGLLEIMSHTAHIMGQNPMKTPIAKKYWEEKKQLVKTFIDAYSFDME